MQVKLSPKSEKLVKQARNRGKPFKSAAEAIEFMLDRFVSRRASIKKWQDEHAPGAKKAKKKSGKTKKAAKKSAGKKSSKRSTVKPARVRSSKPRQAKPNGAAPTSHEESEASASHE